MSHDLQLTSQMSQKLGKIEFKGLLFLFNFKKEQGLGNQCQTPGVKFEE